MKHKIIFLIILTQLFLIIFLGSIVSYKILKNKGILGVSINPIEKKYTVSNPASKLKYFYEPGEDTYQVIEMRWENTNGPEKPIYKINNDGLNQESNYLADNKQEGVYRILTLGDSFTFGDNVNTEDNYPSQLQKILNSQCKNTKFEVINLGVYGYDIQYAVERYRLRGKKYNPDLVLWFIIDDDILRLEELLIPKMKSYENKFKNTNEDLVSIREGKYNSSYHLARDDVIREVGVENIMKLQRQYMEEMNDYFQGNLVLFTFPYVSSEYKKFLKDFTDSRDNSFFL